MKTAMRLSFLVMVATMADAAGLDKEDRTITKVVKLLDSMLEKSRKEGDEETAIYGKFKCYCDSSGAEARASIKELGKDITLLEAKIDEVQGNSGELSSDCENFKKKMEGITDSRAAADALRKSENADFVAEQADLEAAIASMKTSIDALASVGADQTAGNAAADHKKFMGQKSLVTLRSEVSRALAAATAYMSPQQKSATVSLLQKPFTGTYTAQSASVIGILKDLRDTFQANLADVRQREQNAVDTFNTFMAVKNQAYDVTKDSFDEKQMALGENDGTLAAKRSQLAQAQKDKASEEEALEELVAMYNKKTKGYEVRKMLRANEEAAISEGISILNSDASFETFGTTDATSSGSPLLAFIQLSAVHRHLDPNEMGRMRAKKLLELGAQKSARLSKVAALLRDSESPFDTVLAEIDKMMDVIHKEAASDAKNLEWCEAEGKENNDNLKEKNQDILELDEKIDKLTGVLHHEAQGLVPQVQLTESSIQANAQAQKAETEQRLEENMAYQSNIKNVVQAEGVLAKAIKVLKAYYDGLEAKLEAGEAAALLQQKRKASQAPEAWKGEGAYQGQSGAGGNAIQMLEFIASETHKEEMKAHSDEEGAQAAYEDSMANLKAEEASLQKSLSHLQSTVATKEKELLEAQNDHKGTTADKDAIEAYLKKISAGCAFVTENIDQRNHNREVELASLANAQDAIRNTPAYHHFAAVAKVKSYGECKAKCIGDDQTAVCKACRADVTVVGYCAGHPGTKGC